jgi:transposase
VTASEARYELNTALVEKTKKLLGIKGYYTNISLADAPDHAIIVHYGNPWRIEQSFRVAKSDLVARPIFHHKENAIKAHMLICFVALAAGKYLELATGYPCGASSTS